MLTDVLDTLGNIPRRGPSPSFSDVEVVALTLTAGAAPPNTYLLARRIYSLKRFTLTMQMRFPICIADRSSTVANGLYSC